FFSSRRRHTRSKRDWSSDVCSSDLVIYYLFYMADVKEKTNDRYLIPVENGVFNIKSRKLEPFNPDYVFTTKISTRYVESPKNPEIGRASCREREKNMGGTGRKK